jgi:hypothetical protein
MLDRPAKGRNPGAFSAALAELAASFGNRLVTSLAVREQHANITTWHPVAAPDAVVFPQNTNDVQQIVRIVLGIVCQSFRSAQGLRWKATLMRRTAECRST